MDYKPKIYVLHGAITNGGDFLIYRRGRALLESRLGAYFDFIYLPRFEKIKISDIKEVDGLIILGGPILSRGLQLQIENIREMIEHIEKRAGFLPPIVTIGIGVSGEDFSGYGDYFKGEEVIEFWKKIYESSRLVSVRDIETKKVLDAYGIKARLTGCPALYNPNWQNVAPPGKIDSILISIPRIGSLKKYDVQNYKAFLTTMLMLKRAKKEFGSMKIGVAFQHGFSTRTLNIVYRFTKRHEMEVHDLSGKGIDEDKDITAYSMHMGPRLHLHIYFLTLKKPSYLMDIDHRTNAFLKTIKTPSSLFTMRQTKKAIRAVKSPEVIQQFERTEDEINRFRKTLELFLEDVKVLFLENKENGGR